MNSHMQYVTKNSRSASSRSTHCEALKPWSSESVTVATIAASFSAPSMSVVVCLHTILKIFLVFFFVELSSALNTFKDSARAFHYKLHFCVLASQVLF